MNLHIKKNLIRLIVVIVIIYAGLWAFSFKKYDVELGISYSPQYARFLGLDSRETLDAILSDLKPASIRLAVPWSETEATKGTYDFAEVDEMIKKVGDSGARIILTIGQKIPRWPECYIPSWAGELSVDSKRAALLDYVGTTVNRYKDNKAIEFWQVENEPYINFPFGNCELFDGDSVQAEINLVRKIDTSRDIILTDSGELSSYRRPSFGGDILGTTLYRTIRISGGLVAYYDWLPPAYYKIKARIWGNSYKNFFVSELQAEPWFLGDIPTTKQGFAEDTTFSNERFVQNIAYSKKVGASRVYLWGAEWWYFMKTKVGDESYWETAKTIFSSYPQDYLNP